MARLTFSKQYKNCLEISLYPPFHGSVIFAVHVIITIPLSNDQKRPAIVALHV